MAGHRIVNALSLLSHRDGSVVVWYIYHIIRKMENSEQDYLLSNSLSYSRADELFQKEFGRKCGRHKFSGIKKILLSKGLIVKCRNYKVGLRGNCYRTTEGD